MIKNSILRPIKGSIIQRLITSGIQSHYSLNGVDQWWLLATSLVFDEGPFSVGISAIPLTVDGAERSLWGSLGALPRMRITSSASVRGVDTGSNVISVSYPGATPQDELHQSELIVTSGQSILRVNGDDGGAVAELKSSTANAINAIGAKDAASPGQYFHGPLWGFFALAVQGIDLIWPMNEGEGTIALCYNMNTGARVPAYDANLQNPGSPGGSWS